MTIMRYASAGIALSAVVWAFGEIPQDEVRRARIREMQNASIAEMDTHRRGADEKEGRRMEAKGENATDADIKNAFLAATAPRCDYGKTKKYYDYAVALCGGDDRRLCRIAIEIAKERPDRSVWAIHEVGLRGSAEHLPFLYSFTNDVRLCDIVAESIILTEGVTSNSLALAAHVVDQATDDPHKAYLVYSALSCAASKVGATSECKAAVASFLERSTDKLPCSAIWADMFLLSIDETYPQSDRRKMILEKIARLKHNEFQTTYAEQALRSIKAAERHKSEGNKAKR